VAQRPEFARCIPIRAGPTTVDPHMLPPPFSCRIFGPCPGHHGGLPCGVDVWSASFVNRSDFVNDA
jgi:hypothetical protein